MSEATDRSMLDLRWAQIQKTRETDNNSGEPLPGSFGRGFLRWHNGTVDRVIVMNRVDLQNARIQRVHGSQVIDVTLKSLRTELEILEHLAEHHRKLVPSEKQIVEGNWDPNYLPVAVLDEIWGPKG